MRHLANLLGLVFAMLLMLPLRGHTETGTVQVTVNGVLHTIGYGAFLDQQVNDLRDATRFRFRDGVGVSLDVNDASLTRIIQKVSVELPPSLGFPEGVEIDLPLNVLEPDQTGVDFNLGVHSPAPAENETFKFVIRLTTGDKDPYCTLSDNLAALARPTEHPILGRYHETRHCVAIHSRGAEEPGKNPGSGHGSRPVYDHLPGDCGGRADLGPESAAGWVPY
ncbi:MAG TPA: hypothetical protein VGC81_07875 [Candidatus Methylomirabilis sp.]|jgi:hypothetical protein